MLSKSWIATNPAAFLAQYLLLECFAIGIATSARSDIAVWAGRVVIFLATLTGATVVLLATRAFAWEHPPKLDSRLSRLALFMLAGAGAGLGGLEGLAVVSALSSEAVGQMLPRAGATGVRFAADMAAAALLLYFAVQSKERTAE